MNVEKRAFVAESRARDEEHRALDSEEGCRLLEENVWEHLKKQSTDELQECMRRAEERAQFLEESLKPNYGSHLPISRMTLLVHSSQMAIEMEKQAH